MKRSKQNICYSSESEITVKNFLELTYSERSKTGSIITLIALYSLLIFYTILKSFQELSFYNKAANLLLIAVLAVFPALSALVVCFKIRFKNNKIQKSSVYLLYILSPLYMLIVSECLNKVFVASNRTIILVGGYLLISVLYLVLYAVIGRLKLSVIIVNTLLFLLSVANYYVFKFRGTPFLPTDFYAAQTGANVTSSYDFSPDFQLLAAFLLFGFITVLLIKTESPQCRRVANIISRIMSAVVAVTAVILFFFTNIFINIGIVPAFFQQSVSCCEQGFLLNFVSNIRFVFISEPDDYDNKSIKEYINLKNSDISDAEDKKTPNIICIMNEALSDLSVFGSFETNEAYMPFLNSLTENTIKGNGYASVVGGGTSNTEFEFLTGHSMAFLPSGSFPYVSYIDRPISSMVSTLKAQGYSVNVFHPFYASGWNRTEVYGHFGFDKFISLDNMFNSKMREFIKANEFNANALQEYVEKNYPDDIEMFKRNYISDAYDFKEIIKDFESRDKSKPYYMFNITMQNHGGYTLGADNLDENIVVTSLSQNYDDVERYLSLIKYTDSAFKDLTEYFSQVDEPTVICMFGDHQPAVSGEFFNELINSNYESYTDFQKIQNGFCTPFYIWANYDIEEMYIERLSINYLSSYVMKTAGVEITEYNKYLLELSERIPVINVAGYCDSEGNYYSFEQQSPYSELINNYKKVQYNNLFDQENVDYDVFYINGYVPKSTDLSN